MPILDVQLTDTFDQFRQKTNQAIDLVNTLATNGTVLAINNPVGGNVLLFNGTAFANIALSGDVTVDSTGHVTLSGSALGGLTKGRVRFAGSITGLY